MQDLEKAITPFLKEKMRAEQEKVKKFFEHCSYVNGEYNHLESLNQYLKNSSEEENRLFYLGVPPEIFLETSRAIHQVS